MKTITGTVTETIVVQKEVTVEVHHHACDDEVERAIRDKAYENTILDFEDKHGWEGINVENVDIDFENPEPDSAT